MNDLASTRSRGLASFAVFAELQVARRAESLDAAPLLEAIVGSAMFGPNTPCEGFALVFEGSIRVLKASPKGRELALYRVGPGEAGIPSGRCLRSGADYAGKGVAECDVTLLRIAPPLLQQLVAQYPPFRRFVFDMHGVADPARAAAQCRAPRPGRRARQRARVCQPSAAQFRAAWIGPTRARAHQRARLAGASGVLASDRRAID